MEGLLSRHKEQRYFDKSALSGRTRLYSSFPRGITCFKDHRYITVDEKPLFMVYHPLDHPEMKEFIELWRTLAVQNGLKGVYFIGQTYHLKEEKERLMKMGFDAINVVRLFDF